MRILGGEGVQASQIPHPAVQASQVLCPKALCARTGGVFVEEGYALGRGLSPEASKESISSWREWTPHFS